MTGLKVLFNTVEAIDAADVFPRLEAGHRGCLDVLRAGPGGAASQPAGSVRGHLRDAVSFLKGRGHDPMYVEVGYPTHGFKPLAGLYGWGREKDQAAMLKTCYGELADLGVPWMQICECIDPGTERVYDSRLMGDEGRVPKAFGIVPVSEERHWGLLNADGSEKEASGWEI